MSSDSLTPSVASGHGGAPGVPAATGQPGQPVNDREVAAVREFNRFYTNVLGLLREGLLGTPYSLTEARVIFELAREAETQAGHLRRWLDIDAGYLSRLLARFEADGLVTRTRSATDARRQVIGLTTAGRAAFASLDARSSDQIRALLAGLTADSRQRLTTAMAGIAEILDPAPRAATFVLRPPVPGDLGWVVQRHGAFYATEYGWDASFEALVAQIVADFAARAGQHSAGQHSAGQHSAGQHSAGQRGEAAWIAELDGQPAGCVFCMRKDGTTAQLRLLLVEPRARGLGVGSRLVDECVSFARRAGYREIVLWTNDVLHAARRIYQRAGFELTGSQPHRSFGHDLVGQDWRLPLA
jgi:DNA-binding MarR family transcriptional regulator/GNAT superfamily N-acetyltransferase